MHITEFNEKERMFLAGCIRNLILSKGTIENEEIEDLDKIIHDYRFEDFDDKLDEFETEINDEESFWELAKELTDTDKQQFVLTILDELSLQDGLIERAEKKLIGRLREFWSE